MNYLTFLALLVFPLPLVHAATAGGPQSAGAPTSEATLWYRQPAKLWASEALPIGNGRLGAMLFGGVDTERIQFNEISLWGGANNWDGGFDTSDTGFGGYRNFGDVLIRWNGHSAPEKGVGVAPAPSAEVIPSDYRRSLDLREGIHRVSFTTAEGVKVSREAFASRPDQVIVMRYKADQSAALSGMIQLKSGQSGAAPTSDATGIAFHGALSNNLKFAGALRVLHHGGTVTPVNGGLSFSQCDELTLLLDARTDYQPSHSKGWRGADPLPIVHQELSAAAARPADALRQAHVADLAGLLARVSLDLGRSAPELAALPTDERIKRYVDEGRFQKGGDDPELEAMLFQMGRYLLASSSRPGGLPANLQGLWNDSNRPAWASDYHNNINIEMNYWPAESTGLGECAVPLIDFVRAQAQPCRIATRKAFGDKTRGWTARTSQSPFGGNGWEWNIPASAWYALHLFDHWDFGRDERYLREQAYPVLKETCEYWEDRLKQLPDGTLVAPAGWSPEHGPREDGVMHDQQLIWELFDDYLKAAKVLGVDPDYQQRVAAMQAKLAPNKIGKWGQLQEWQTDRDDPNDRHRHTSHLFALYPGRQISLSGTPELARAARVSLLARSSDREDQAGKPWTPAQMHAESIYGWVWSWRAAMWARLGDAERAHALVWGKMGNTAPNLMGLNVPYFKNHQELIQLDNSFGITAAMAEMLLQSHAGEIHLLPALPKAWSNGSFHGLRARGNIGVDAHWRDGKLLKAVLVLSPQASRVPVRLAGSLLDSGDPRISWSNESD